MDDWVQEYFFYSSVACSSRICQTFILLSLSDQVGKKPALADQEEEWQRRISESITEEDAKRRIDIALKLVYVQKELLAAHPPIKVINMGEGLVFVFQ